MGEMTGVPRGVVVSTLWCLAWLWLEIRLEMLSLVVSWFPPCGIVVSTPWCRGFHLMVSTLSSLVDGSKFDWKCCHLWCRGFHPVVSTLSSLVNGSKLDWKCCPPCCHSFHPPWCRGVLPGSWLEIRLEICLRGFP